MATVVEVLTDLLQADEYLRGLLASEAVDVSTTSPVRNVLAELMPLIRNDFFLSIAPSVREPLHALHEALFAALRDSGYAPRRQNVSLNIRLNGHSVDLVSGHRQNLMTEDHSLYVRKHRTWIMTNVTHHIAHVRAAKRQDEIRILKLWRNQHSLDFPSFYLELVVIRVLAVRHSPYLSANVNAVFEYLRDAFAHARFVDPANGNNVLSDSLTNEEKHTIAAAARMALATPRWREIVR